MAVKTKIKSTADGLKSADVTVINIPAPNFQRRIFDIVGTSPLMISRFAAREQMIDTQEAGATGRSKKKREPKNFEALFNASRHVSTEGWDGIHAAAFRNAAISACRTVGFKMTHAKLGVWAVADGMGEDGTPLVRIIGKPEMDISPARNSDFSVDLRSRAIYKKWAASPTMEWDADMFTETDIVNLLTRIGRQVGVGEGRPDSRRSAGLGYGLFTVEAVRNA